MENQCLLLGLLPEEKEILTWKRTKSPGKELRDQRRLNQFKAKRRRLSSYRYLGFAGTNNCKPEEKGSVTEDSGIDLDFSECERMDRLNLTKTEILAYNTDTMDNLEG